MSFLQETFEYGEALLEYFKKAQGKKLPPEIWANIADKANAIYKNTPDEDKSICGRILLAFQEEAERRLKKEE